MGALNELAVADRHVRPEQRTISMLEDRVRRLQDEIDILKEALRGIEKRNRPWRTDWGLTPSESIAFDVLVKHHVAYKEALMAALYYDRHPDRVPAVTILDVLMHKLRRKLTPRGIKIYTKFGVGWFLDKEVRASLGRDEPHLQNGDGV